MAHAAESAFRFDDHEREAAEATRKPIVSPAPRSAAAPRKKGFKRTEDAYPVQSLRGLLDGLAAVTNSRARLRQTEAEFHEITQATSLQQRAFDLLGLAQL